MLHTRLETDFYSKAGLRPKNPSDRRFFQPNLTHYLPSTIKHVSFPKIIAHYAENEHFLPSTPRSLLWTRACNGVVTHDRWRELGPRSNFSLPRVVEAIYDLIKSGSVMCDCLSRTNDVMSSANVTDFISFPSTLTPFILMSLRIEIDNNSRTMIKSGRICLMLSYTTIFVTTEGSIGGGSWCFRPSPRGGSHHFQRSI